MTSEETQLVDELRREFRRTRPPRRAMRPDWTAAIFRVCSPWFIGYRILWFPADQQERAHEFTTGIYTFYLLETLPHEQ